MCLVINELDGYDDMTWLAQSAAWSCAEHAAVSLLQYTTHKIPINNFRSSTVAINHYVTKPRL